jgi:hypothetical protein
MQNPLRGVHACLGGGSAARVTLRQGLRLAPFRLSAALRTCTVSGMRVEAVNSMSGAEASIEIPWRDADGNVYFDLRENPRAISKIEAAREHPALAGFLSLVNSQSSLLATSRVKLWREDPPRESSESSFHSRIDLFFAHDVFNSSADKYEEVVRRLVELWMRDLSPDALAIRLDIIPCRYGSEGRPGAALRITFSAHGANAEQARTRWALGLVRVQQALLFISRGMRQKLGIDN